MATLDLQPIKVSRTKFNSTPRIEWKPVATGQTLHEGQPVYLVNNQVTEVSSDGVSVYGIIAKDCLSLTANTLVPVYVDDGNTIFKGNVYKTGDLTASLSAGTLVGGLYAIAVVTTSSRKQAHIDIADTDHDAIEVEGFGADIESVEGDLYGLMEFTFKPARQIG